MDTTRIFIGNLDFSVTADEVQGLLSQYGTVAAIKMNQKKGFAFIEMGRPEEAAQAVEQLDGTLHKGRTLRLSFEMKARKARAVSVQRYKERGDAFARQKAARYQAGRHVPEEKPAYPGRPAGEGARPAYKRGPRPDAGFAPRTGPVDSDVRPGRPYQRATGTPPRPARRAWTEEKPAYPRRPAGEGARPANKRGPRPDAGFAPRKRPGESDTQPGRPYQRATGTPLRPASRAWTERKPAYPGRPAGEGARPAYKRGPRPDAGFAPRPGRPYEHAAGMPPRPASRAWTEKKPLYPRRSAGEGARPAYARPPKKELSSPGQPQPGLKTGDSRADHSKSKKIFDRKPRDYAQSRTAGSAPGGFKRPVRPGVRGAAGNVSSSRPSARANSSGRGKPPRRD